MGWELVARLVAVAVGALEDPVHATVSYAFKQMLKVDISAVRMDISRYVRSKLYRVITPWSHSQFQESTPVAPFPDFGSNSAICQDCFETVLMVNCFTV